MIETKDLKLLHELTADNELFYELFGIDFQALDDVDELSRETVGEQSEI